MKEHILVFYFLFIFGSHHTARGILVFPKQGSNPQSTSPAVEAEP